MAHPLIWLHTSCMGLVIKIVLTGYVQATSGSLDLVGWGWEENNIPLKVLCALNWSPQSL